MRNAIVGLLVGLSIAAVAVACSGTSNNADVNLDGNESVESNDTAADAGAGADATAPPACYTASAAPTTCTAPTLKAGGTFCDDTQISAFIEACLVNNPDAGDTCSAWLAGSGASACGGCLKTWSFTNDTGKPVGLDTASCYYAQTP